MQVSVKRPSFIKQEMVQPTAEKMGWKGSLPVRADCRDSILSVYSFSSLSAAARIWSISFCTSAGGGSG
jgi:hypothetical protein